MPNTYSWQIDAVDAPYTQTNTAPATVTHNEDGTTTTTPGATTTQTACNVHWRCNGTDGTHNASVYATLVTPYTAPAAGVGLALSDVVGWVQTAMGTAGVAAVEANLDSQIAAAAAAPAVAPALAWMVPPVPTLAQVQAGQSEAIVNAAQAALQAVVAGYPDLEVATWPQQYAEAQAYTASSTASTPMLSAIATASGQTVAALAAGVIAKAAAYQAASGAIVGKRIALLAQIAATTTTTAALAINW